MESQLLLLGLAMVVNLLGFGALTEKEILNYGIRQTLVLTMPLLLVSALIEQMAHGVSLCGLHLVAQPAIQQPWYLFTLEAMEALPSIITLGNFQVMLPMACIPILD